MERDTKRDVEAKGGAVGWGEEGGYYIIIVKNVKHLLFIIRKIIN